MKSKKSRGSKAKKQHSGRKPGSGKKGTRKKDDKKMDYTIVIPAYNEEEHIEPLLSSLVETHTPSKIIVVDDGSSDRTAQFAGQFGVNVITHESNLGKGAAVKTGANASETEKIVLIDGDNQHDANQVSLILEALSENDLVLGSRFRAENKMPFYRLVANMLIRALILPRTNEITDPLSGFRGFRKSSFNFEEEGFNTDLEMVFDAIDNKAKISEVPINAIYFKKRTSKFSNLPRAVHEYLKLFSYALLRMLKLKK